MKNLILKLALALLALSIYSCDKPESGYEVQYSDNGKDSVVKVDYVDQNGQDHNFFMQYLMFRTLYSNGGYGSCYQYYNQHTTTAPFYTSPSYRSYSNYEAENSPSVIRGTSSPTRSSSWSSSSSSSRGYSSPSRSSSSSSSYRSYSSPSRSYSSPSRSFSSPSRGR